MSYKFMNIQVIMIGRGQRKTKPKKKGEKRKKENRRNFGNC